MEIVGTLRIRKKNHLNRPNPTASPYTPHENLPGGRRNTSDLIGDNNLCRVQSLGTLQKIFVDFTVK